MRMTGCSAMVLAVIIAGFMSTPLCMAQEASVKAAGKATVAVMQFDDGRYEKDAGQKSEEVKSDMQKAIMDAMALDKHIVVVTKEAASGGNPADITVTGKILKCEGQRKEVGKGRILFIGKTAVEVTFADAKGAKLSGNSPLGFEREIKNESSGAQNIGLQNESAISTAVKQSIRDIAQSLVSSKEFKSAVTDAAAKK